MKHDLIIDSDGKAIRRPTPSFASRLAAAMALPLRRHLDYQGLARRVLHVEPLPQGALPYYEKDIDVVSTLGCFDKPDWFKHNRYSINDEGKAGRRGIAGRVIMPKFEVYSNPTIKIADVKRRRFNLIDRTPVTKGPRITGDGKAIVKTRQRRRFDVIDRAVQKARAEIMAQEDAAIFKALDDAGKDE